MTKEQAQAFVNVLVGTKRIKRHLFALWGLGICRFPVWNGKKWIGTQPMIDLLREVADLIEDKKEETI